MASSAIPGTFVPDLTGFRGTTKSCDGTTSGCTSTSRRWVTHPYLLPSVVRAAYFIRHSSSRSEVVMKNFSRKGAKAQRKPQRRFTDPFAPLRLCGRTIFALSITLLIASSAAHAQKDSNDYLFNDSHFHLTN